MATNILDNRHLPPPEPLLRTLRWLEDLSIQDEHVTIITDRQPYLLFPELEERGYEFEVEERNDGIYTHVARTPRQSR